MVHVTVDVSTLLPQPVYLLPWTIFPLMTPFLLLLYTHCFLALPCVLTPIRTHIHTYSSPLLCPSCFHTDTVFEVAIGDGDHRRYWELAHVNLNLAPCYTTTTEPFFSLLLGYRGASEATSSQAGGVGNEMLSGQS